MLYSIIALVLSLSSVSGFAVAGVRPVVNMRATVEPTMSFSALDQATQLMAVVPARTTDIVYNIGASGNPNFGGVEGAYAAYTVAILAVLSIISRNGTKGLSPSTGGWDNNKDGSRVKRGGGGFAPRLTPGGVEKVRFPASMGGPERPAAGQAGNGLLFAGLFPVILEISRAMQLPVA